ncbi:MAG: GAF domain-containing protein [Leucobacter sp.]
MSDVAQPPSLAQIVEAISTDAPIEAEQIRRAATDDTTADALIELAHRTEALRRRSTELRAVMSSTRDLLAITDPDKLLQRIVDRAHELMELDVAYLSVHDEATDQLHVRAATGVTSPRFVNMVVPAGIGIASLAVHTRQPHWVEDYVNLSAVPHDPVIDEIVREEQLRSLLGAPLVVAGKVLGVLFGASRTPHAFRPDEVSLLSTFAGHAALVLHRTNLLHEARDATSRAAERQREAEWGALIHERFTRLAAYDADSGGIIETLADALGRDVALVGTDGSPVIPTGTAISAAPVAPDIARAASTGRSEVLGKGPIEFVAPLVTAAGHSGALVVARGVTPLSPVQQRTAERAAMVAALVTLRRDAITDAEDRVRGELAAELFGEASRNVGVQRAADRGYPVDGPWTLVTIACAPEQRGAVLSRLRGDPAWLVTTAPGGVAVLAPFGADGPSPQRILDHAGSGAELALTAERNGLGAAAAAAERVWLATELAKGLELSHGIHPEATLAPYATLFAGDGALLGAFIRERLGEVFNRDRSHGSRLFDTLVTLFDERWNLTAASRSLHLHLNTVKQRVQRLREILGEDLRQPEGRFRLELAVRAELARRSLDQP